MVRYSLFAIALLCATPWMIVRADDTEKSSKVVQLTIDFGDGFQKRYTAIKPTAKMTVFDALQVAQKHRRSLKVVARGKGETTFVVQLDDQKNEGAGKNWLFYVNGKLGKRSCGVAPVKAGDKVLWRFGKYSN